MSTEKYRFAEYFHDFTAEKEQNLLELLRAEGHAPAAPCGGRGLCGKCRVLLRRDGRTEEVLACRTAVQGPFAVALPEEGGDLSWNEGAAPARAAEAESRAGCGAAADLGTTTVALSLFDLESGLCLGRVSEWNAQKSFGADVLSRIQACREQGGPAPLTEAIRAQLLRMLRELCRSCGRAMDEVREIVLAGNTVMQHLFAGLSPDSIAVPPFTPLSLFDGPGPHSELDGIPVFLSPCVAGYVGGDITAGLLAAELDRRDETALFIDVGTNGEMVLRHKGRFTACAVASGPAFEGAGISCGMPAAFGAVHAAKLTEGALSFRVLGGGEARGLCGSGLLDLAACLLDRGDLDERGRLKKEAEGKAVFRLTEQVQLTQKDVRQLQLAKAAVAAGIRLLLQENGLRPEELDALYLAGGFGSRLNPASAIRIGMLPAELRDRILPLSGACLSGAEQVLLAPAKRAALLSLKEKCRYLELSGTAAFNQCFIEEMNFPGEE